MSRSARKRAWSEVDYTCPHVEEAFDDMYRAIMRMSLDELNGEPLEEIIAETMEKVKEQTTALRNALIEAYEEMEEALEDKDYEHAKEVADLRKQIDSFS